MYELLGVRLFKRYLLPTERLVSRLRGGSALKASSEKLHGVLKQLILETKRNELIHWLALLLFGIILAINAPRVSVIGWGVVVAVNLYVNVYPILVQRFNRARLVRTLQRAPLGVLLGVDERYREFTCAGDANKSMERTRER